MISNISYLTSYPPRRRRKGINKILEKERGDDLVTNCRPYFCMKQISIKMFVQEIKLVIELAKSISTHEYENHKLMGATDNVLNPSLVTDIARK